MTWIILQFLFLVMPVAITSALYKSNHRFMDRFYERMVRNEKARKLHTWVLLTVLLLYHYVYTNGHPGEFGIVFSTIICAALASYRRTDRWLRYLLDRPRAFAIYALVAVVIAGIPHLHTLAVTIAFVLLAALFYPPCGSCTNGRKTTWIRFSSGSSTPRHLPKAITTIITRSCRTKRTTATR